MSIRYAVFLRVDVGPTVFTSVIHETADTAAEAIEKVSTILGEGWKAVGALPRNAKAAAQSRGAPRL